MPLETALATLLSQAAPEPATESVSTFEADGRVLALGLTIVSLVTAVVVVTVGSIPFLGLIVPNLVSMAVGDNVRRGLPWVALTGALFVLVCDILGRTIRAPYEVPLGTIVGVLGSGLFLFLLLKDRKRLG